MSFTSKGILHCLFCFVLFFHMELSICLLHKGLSQCAMVLRTEWLRTDWQSSKQWPLLWMSSPDFSWGPAASGGHYHWRALSYDLSHTGPAQQLESWRFRTSHDTEVDTLWVSPFSSLTQSRRFPACVETDCAKSENTQVPGTSVGPGNMYYHKDD